MSLNSPFQFLFKNSPEVPEEDHFRTQLRATLSPYLFGIFLLITYVVIPVNFGASLFSSPHFYIGNCATLGCLLSYLSAKRGWKEHYSQFILPIIFMIISVAAILSEEFHLKTPFAPYYAGSLAILFSASFLKFRPGLVLSTLFIIGVMIASYFSTIPPFWFLHRMIIVFVLFIFSSGFAYSREKVFYQLNKQKRELVGLSGIQTVSELSGGIAHEINNPLTIIIGFVSKLKKDVSKGFDQEKFDRSIVKIEDSCQRIAKIVQGLNSLATESCVTEKRTLNLNRSVKSALTNLNDAVNSRGINVTFKGYPEDVLVHSVPSHVLQVVYQVVQNSIDSIKNTESPWIEVSIEKTKQEAVISFIDSGHGFTSEEAIKVIRPFYTTKSSQGAGLGLTKVQRALNFNDGTIEIDHNSANAKVVVRLPLAL
jgi:signal transduction histidine kinase